MRPARLPVRVAVLLAALAVAPAGAEPAVRALGPGSVVRDELAPGVRHLFTVELAAGDLLELVVDQRGVDVVTEVHGPDGARLLTADRNIGPRGPEPLALVAGSAGVHRIEVRAGGSAGEYELTVAAVRPASEGDRLRARAVRLVYETEIPRPEVDPGPAFAALAEAADLWGRMGDPAWEGEAADRLCRGAVNRREWTAAADACARAADRFEVAGDLRRRGRALQPLAVALSAKGDTGGAIEAFGEALELARETDDARTAVSVLHSRGQAHQIRDEVQSALDDYEAALDLAGDLGNRSAEARTLHDLGVLHRVLAAPAAATERLEQAEEMFAELGDHRSRAASLNQLGHLAQEAGDLRRAGELYDRALELRQAARDRRGEAVTLTKIAGLHRARGDLAEALETYQDALGHLGDQEEPWVRAHTLAALAGLLEEAGRREDARARYEQAAGTYRGVGDATGEAEGLLGLARNRPPGGAEAAVEAAEAGLALLETVRGRALRDDLRTSFFASVRGHYDLVIDLMMELERARPGAGWAARALGVAESARARALLDRLGENAAAFRRGVDPGLIDEELRLRDELSGAETRRLRLLELDLVEQAATVDRNVRHLAEELEAARAMIRAASPRYAEATEPRILAGDEIGRLLDPDTLLLAYHLGEARGHLWLVGQAGVTAFELPPPAELEDAAREGHELLASRSPLLRARLASVLCRLADGLLGPVAGRLGAARLVVVPDGALHYVPFAALPERRAGAGCTGAAPLLAGHEIVHLPSASALAAVRREREGRLPPRGLVAVLADPVFDPEDPRMTEDGARPPADRTPAASEYPRLPYTRDEADAILALAPAEHSFAAFGFEADKQAVLGGRLAGYRLVHLATHGLLDETDPARSGLVLSQVDRRGRPQDGFLRAHELYDLELAADLVVLSGCGTALGREVRGEGLVGLARGFLTAGASSLMVSLWRVSDRATARLMEELYRQILGAGDSPAAALRAAQLAAWRRGAPPAEWAAFVLQGDWRTAPAAGERVTATPAVPPTLCERSPP